MNGGIEKLTVAQMIKLLVGIILFGMLMGMRDNFEGRWVRAAVAGCAGGILGWIILQCRKSRDKD